MAEQSQSAAKRRIALAAFALLALAAAAAAIIGTHGSSWGKVCVRVHVRLAAVCRDGPLAAHSFERAPRPIYSTHGCLGARWPMYNHVGLGGRPLPLAAVSHRAHPPTHSTQPITHPSQTASKAPDASHIQHPESFEVKSILDALNKGAVTNSGVDEVCVCACVCARVRVCMMMPSVGLTAPLLAVNICRNLTPPP